jgi:hypothetical protein
MNDALELLLKDTFDDDAQDAPAAVGLAVGARTRLRRRRFALGGAAATAAVVLAVSALAWGGSGTTAARPGPAPADGGVTVEPQPSPTSEYCPASTDCVQQVEIDALRRPLHLPAVAPGAACPVSASHTMPAGGGFNTPYPAVGDGPFRLTGPGRIEMQDPPPAGDSLAGTGWNGMKVIWHIDQEYEGPVLLRGARVDGAGELRFERYLGALAQGDEPTGYADVAYPPLGGLGTLRTFPSGIVVQSPGCYAIQADGANFSEIIVVQVVFARR